MALPTLDAVFASAADQPRRYMLSQWLVGEKEEVGSSSVLVSGAGSEEVNGVYTERGTFNGKPYYNLVGEDSQPTLHAVVWDNDEWRIRPEDDFYISTSDTAFPWQATNWQISSGEEPVPTVTEIPAANPIANYLTLPERYLWAKIAVAAGAPKDEAFYINAPKQYAWKDIYNAVSGSSLGTIDWGEKQALGHIAAAYRGDTGNPANLATYINWPWRYQVAAIITQLAEEEEPVPNGNGGPTTFNAVIVSGAGTESLNGTYTERGEIFGKPYYNKIGSPDSSGILAIRFADPYWFMGDEEGEDAYQTLEEDPALPWEGTWETLNAEPPPPTLTPTNV